MNYANERIRPHGAFYLIPVFSLIIGVGICAALIVGAALSMSFEELSVGSIKYIDVKEPETVYIMAPTIASGNLTVKRIEKNRYLVTFDRYTSVEFTFKDINNSQTEITMDEIGNSVEYYVNDYSVILKIDLPAEGNYSIKAKYNTEYYNPIGLAISVGIGRLFQSIFAGILSVAFGFLVAIISFAVIISKRSYCRRMIREQQLKSQSASIRL
jgi:hypothetical protein